MTATLGPAQTEPRDIQHACPSRRGSGVRAGHQTFAELLNPAPRSAQRRNAAIRRRREANVRATGRGMTLIEIMVAVAVFALVSTMVFGGLSQTVRNKQAV